MSTVIDIADAVVAALNEAGGHAFSQPFTAQRCYVPTFDLKEMKDLHVTVVPRSLEMVTAGRSLLQNDVQIDLAVQKKLPTDTTGDSAAIDALMGLVQEIAEFIRSTGRFGEAVWMKTENKPIYSPEHLEQLRQFTSVLTVTYRAMS